MDEFLQFRVHDAELRLCLVHVLLEVPTEAMVSQYLTYWRPKVAWGQVCVSGTVGWAATARQPLEGYRKRAEAKRRVVNNLLEQTTRQHK